MAFLEDNARVCGDGDDGLEAYLAYIGIPLNVFKICTETGIGIVDW